MPVHDRTEPDALRYFARAFVDARRRDKAQQRVRQKCEFDVFEHGLAVQRTRMLEDDTDAGARDTVWRPACHFHIIELYRSAVDAFDAHDQLHHRRLARTVRSDQPENLAGVNVETDVLDGDQTAETLRQAANRQATRPVHSRSPARST